MREGKRLAGNVADVTESSRCAAPPLRYGPAGDTAPTATKWLVMAGRVLPAINGPAE